MKLSDEAQEKLFREIGSHLQQVRQEHGISIEQVSMHTRIKPAFLLALEEGQAEELPEAIFVQGFIRRYAEGMGLNGVNLADKFSPLLPAVEVKNEDLNLEKKSSLYVPLAVPYILLLAVASFGLFYILHPKQSKESVAQKPVVSKVQPIATNSPASVNRENPGKTVVATPTSIASIAATPESTPTPTPTASITATTKPTPTPITSITATPESTPTPTSTTVSSGVETGIELQDESWIRVKVDGKTVFEGTLKKGEKQNWTAQKEIWIRSGNAGAVLVSVNKQPATVMGGVGKVKEVKYNNTPVPPM